MLIQAKTPAKPKIEFQKGICYTTWSKNRYSTPESDASIKQLASTGASWASILTTWYQDKCYTTKIYPTEKTPSDESIVHAIKTMHSLGLKVMLKPHLDVVDASGGSWRGEISCISDPDWEEWFASYRDFVVHYARLAQANNVEMFCIGTELTTIATMKEATWKEKVIAPVREVYKGPLTYAANWNEEFEHVKFWDALDYVGIDAYFPLSDKDAPALDEIKKGWEEWVKQMEAFQARVNKPIIFPEVGYCSANGTTETPWEELSGTLNLDLQKDCYEALFQTFWDKDWFYGVYWWRWGTDTRFGGPNNRGYTFQNKPAQATVTSWYAKAIPPKRAF
jgi:hypothetical protein